MVEDGPTPRPVDENIVKHKICRVMYLTDTISGDALTRMR